MVDEDKFPDLTAEMIGAACVMLRRTGASEVQIRYSDDEKPIIWMAAAGCRISRWEHLVTYEEDRLIKEKLVSGVYWQAAGGMDPLSALLRLCEMVVDGGTCKHCKKVTGFTTDIDDMPGSELIVCWYQWDPELGTFRRGCEGSNK